LEERKIEYAIEIPDQPVIVNVDPDSYLRTLNNLMQNVLAHSQADAVHVLLAMQEDTLRLSVADNGIGKEDLKQIFSRLYKCDRGRSEKGSGLGLSIACQLAEKMRGQLTADSSPGQGAVFVLTLPLAK